MKLLKLQRFVKFNLIQESRFGGLSEVSLLITWFFVEYAQSAEIWYKLRTAISRLFYDLKFLSNVIGVRHVERAAEELSLCQRPQPIEGKKSRTC